MLPALTPGPVPKKNPAFLMLSYSPVLHELSPDKGAFGDPSDDEAQQNDSFNEESTNLIRIGKTLEKLASQENSWGSCGLVIRRSMVRFPVAEVKPP